MSLKSKITVITLLFFVGLLKGQDLHFTNNTFASPFFNPAQTGDFLGTYRISALARDQWSNFIFEPYQTQMINIDSPQALGFRKQDWLGLGLGVYNDKAGDIGFKNIGFFLGASYHYSLDKKQKKVFSVGVQYGQIQRNATDPDRAQFEDGLNQSGTSSPDLALLEQFRDSYSDLNIGIQYKQKYKKTDLLNIGLSYHHLLSPDFEALVLDNYIPERINFYIYHEHQFNKKFSIKYGHWSSLAGLFNSRHSVQTNVNIQAIGALKLNTKKKRNKEAKKAKDIDLVFGLGYRVSDALQLISGINYEQWSLIFSFDMTVSAASNYNNNNGAYELGIQRIINVYKEPKVDSVILCPKF